MGQITDNGRKLIEALRSGDYKQGRYTLTTRHSDGDRDCCLGVVCKLAIEDGVEVSQEEIEGCGHAIVTYDKETSCLPDQVKEWIGFSTYSGAYGQTGNSLMSTNDSGCTFAEIAAIIESAPQGLFADAV